MHEDRETVKKNIAARYANITTKTDEEEEFKQRLICCETDIDCGRHGYYDMGNAFRTILENKLYIIAGHKKFLDYIEVRYDRKKSSVYRLISIADLYDMLAEIVGEDKMPDTAYALGSIVHLESDQAEKVYTLALENAEADGEMVTAAYIKRAREELGLSKAQLAKKSEEAIVIDEEDEEPDEDANAVRMDAKRKAVSKRATENDGDTHFKPAQEKYIETRKLLRELRKEEEIRFDFLHPVLIALGELLMEFRRQQQKLPYVEKRKIAMKNLIDSIGSVCGKEWRQNKA